MSTQAWSLKEFRKWEDLLIEEYLQGTQIQTYQLYRRFEVVSPQTGVRYQVLSTRSANIIVPPFDGLGERLKKYEASKIKHTNGVRICWTVPAPLPAQLLFQLGLIRANEELLWSQGRIWANW